MSQLRLLNRKTILSPDRIYRYVLWREWDMMNPSYAMFVGLNPSTADENVDDPTIRKCVGFAKRWGYGALCMTNLFAFRATKPEVMLAFRSPIGVENDKFLIECAVEARVIVAAWGPNGEHLHRDDEVLKLLSGVQCLRRTPSGFPEHPLYVPYEVSLAPYVKDDE